MLRFDLGQGETVDLSVFTAGGQRVVTLVSGARGAGSFSVHWDGRDDDGDALASGVYLYRLETENLVEVRKLLLLR